MAKGFLGASGYKAYLGNIKLKKGYIGDRRVYSAGNVVTYNVSPGVSYQEEVDSDASVLSPTSFTPSLSGWTFVGWREDTAASGSVLTSKTMGDDPIALYAVFRQTVTLSYNGNGNTSGSTAAQAGMRYYNNGNILNPSFSLRTNGFGKTNYYFTAWAIGGASGTQYAPGKTVTLSQNTVFYACWHINMYTITYRYNNTVVKTSSVAHGTLISNYTPTAVSGKTFLGWSSSSTGKTPQTIYATGNMTLYGIGRPKSAPVSGTPYKTIGAGQNSNNTNYGGWWEDENDNEASFNLTVPAGAVTVVFYGMYRDWTNGWMQVGANGVWSQFLNIPLSETTYSVQVSLQTTGALNITAKADRQNTEYTPGRYREKFCNEVIKVYCAGDVTG